MAAAKLPQSTPTVLRWTLGCDWIMLATSFRTMNL